MGRFDEQVAIVTGSGNGIGRATAIRLAAEGARVTVAEIEVDSGHETVELITRAGGSAIYSRTDTTDSASVKEAVSATIAAYGDVDVLVNNAGAFHVAGSWMEIMGSGVLDLMQVNLAAPMALIQHVAPFMQERGWGRIVNISSISVEHGGNPASVGYTASKAALEVLTYSWAKTLARDGVLMNALRVGLTDTDFHQRNPGKSMETRVAQVPLGRMATAEEIASTIFFYGSNQNSFATGSIIKVAGGE